MIGNDGRPTNQPYVEERDGGNLHTMYLREKPLLEKIRQMRQEREAMEARMKQVMDENAQLVR